MTLYGRFAKESLDSALRSFAAVQPKNNATVSPANLVQVFSTRGLDVTDVPKETAKRDILTYLCCYESVGRFVFPYCGNRAKQPTLDRCLLVKDTVLAVANGKTIKPKPHSLPRRARCSPKSKRSKSV